MVELVAGLIPGVERQPKKKIDPDGGDLLRLLHAPISRSATARDTALRFYRQRAKS